MNSIEKYYLSGEGGGSRQLLVLLDNDCNKVQESIIVHTENITKEDIRKLYLKNVEQMCEKQGINATQISGIGMGSAGFCNKDYSFTEAPNTPKSLEIIDFVPYVGNYFDIENRIGFNDCQAGTIAANSKFGHQKKDIRVGRKYLHEPAANGSFYNIRLAQRPFDKLRKNYVAVAYVTISSGNNFGIILNLDDGSKVIMDGCLGMTPEAGHISYKEKDPFGNPILCGCGGTRCLEQSISGGNSDHGLIGMLKKAYLNNQITDDKILNYFKTHPNTREGLIGLPKLIYEIPRGSSKNADAVKDAISESIAVQISHLISVVGLDKIEFGGSMIKDYKQNLVEAIDNIAKNPRQYCSQPKDFSSFPDFCVANNFGKDYVWQGPAIYLKTPKEYKFLSKQFLPK